jgi:methylmalonyl-CoA mutase C-terminal domain/subunit
VLAKIGLDGHDRGVQIVARALRDAGMEVIYTGLWQSLEAVVRAVEEEDADVLGISLLSGAHMSLMPPLMDALRQRGLEHVIVILGGIIPEEDLEPLARLGIARVFTPGASLTEVAHFIRQAVGR